MPAHRVRAAPRAPDGVAGRLRRRPHHRPGRAVPGPARRGPDLLQPGEAVRPGAADLLPVRTVGRGRRLHPGLLRHRDHGRGQRLDVPRLAPHGRDGDRRAAPRSRRWAAPGCTPPCRGAATTSPSTTPTRSSRPGPCCRTCPAPGRRRRRPTSRWRPPATLDAVDRARWRTPRATTCTTLIDALVDAESFFEVKPLFAPELIVGLRAARRPTGRHRGQQPDAARRHAVRRLVGQGGPLHLVVRRVQRAARVPRRRARLHDRHRRSSARASSATGRRWSPPSARPPCPRCR